MYYRSDWPEVGLTAAYNEKGPGGDRPEAKPDWIEESHIGKVAVRWIATKNRFESDLYRFPIWELRLELDNAGGSSATDGSAIGLNEAIVAGIRQFVSDPPWGAAYLSSRVLREEPLFEALSGSGFQEVERRRIYNTRPVNISSGECHGPERNLRFLTLAESIPERRGRARDQIFEICEKVFGERGYSRHFTDAFLLARLAGYEYIKAAMELNLERLDPGAFLLAVDKDSGRVCGFSVIGKKPGLIPNIHTQLLSAVHPEYQGQGIYAGITELLVRILPRDSILLNVTHADNHAIQAAYRRSGRVHLADTVVMRRVLGAGSDAQ